nr:Mobile element protein [Escherichia coli]
MNKTKGCLIANFATVPYRQQIKTFRLKYVFLAAKIIKTARYVIMKLSENYPYKGVYEKCLV